MYSLVSGGNWFYFSPCQFFFLSFSSRNRATNVSPTNIFHPRLESHRPVQGWQCVSSKLEGWNGKFTFSISENQVFTRDIYIYIFFNNLFFFCLIIFIYIGRELLFTYLLIEKQNFKNFSFLLLLFLFSF